MKLSEIKEAVLAGKVVYATRGVSEEVVPKDLAEDCDVYPVVERGGGEPTNK